MRAVRLSSCFVVATALAITVGAAKQEFCYDHEDCGPETWEGLCNVGSRQSPIDIPRESSTAVFESKLSFSRDYLHKQSFQLKNNGNTAMLTLESGSGPYLPTVSGLTEYLGSSTYVFSNLHFHWGPSNRNGSEHTVSGVSHPFEVHIVHYREDFPNLEAARTSKEANAVLIIAVLYELSGADNKGLEPIIELLPQIEEPSREAVGHIDDVLHLLPHGDRKSRHEQSAGRRIHAACYEGSQATPDCEEVTHWLVLLTPSHVSPRQLKAFRSLRSPRGEPILMNSRPVQRTYGRILRYFDLILARAH